MFEKRGEVGDGHDRYANMKVNYLLPLEMPARSRVNLKRYARTPATSSDCRDPGTAGGYRAASKEAKRVCQRSVIEKLLDRRRPAMIAMSTPRTVFPRACTGVVTLHVARPPTTRARTRPGDALQRAALWTTARPDAWSVTRNESVNDDPALGFAGLTASAPATSTRAPATTFTVNDASLLAGVASVAPISVTRATNVYEPGASATTMTLPSEE